MDKVTGLVNIKVVNGKLVKANSQADLAHSIFIEITTRKNEITKNFLELGRLFKEVADGKLYKVLGYDTFEEFLGLPEISLKRSTVFGLIQIYKLYVEKLGLEKEFLAEIGHAKLRLIAPLVAKSNEVDDWIYKAKELSRSDLISEVRQAQGKPDEIPGKEEGPTQHIAFYKSYVEFVKTNSCCVCGNTQVDAAHFPITRAAGGDTVKDWVIPLCRKCHAEFHDDPQKFSWTWKKHVFRYFYRVIFEAFKILNEKEVPNGEGPKD